MLICLPGSASSVKRAPTSATRSAPFAITMNCTIAMIKNTTIPTATLPPTTNLPKVSMIWPAWPCNRIERVEAMFNDKRSSVVNSSRAGKVDSANGVLTYIAIISNRIDSAILTAIRPSSSAAGNGSTISEMTAIASSASTPSAIRLRISTGA